MSKSPAVIGAMGIAGCLALSLMMRGVLEVHREQRRDPLESALESRFGPRLARPVRVRSQRQAGETRITVELCVLAGLQKGRFAESTGRMVWEHCRAQAREPDEVVIVITDDGAGERLAVPVPRPPFWR